MMSCVLAHLRDHHLQLLVGAACLGLERDAEDRGNGVGLGRRNGDGQSLEVLLEGDFLVASQQLHFLHVAAIR